MIQSEEKTRLLIGKLVLEQSQYEKQISALRVELSRRARAFAHIGRLLVFAPERIWFEGQIVPKEFEGEPAVDRCAMEVDALISELRDAIAQKNDCVRQLAGLGIDPEESEREQNQRNSRAIWHPANVRYQPEEEVQRKSKAPFGFQPKKNK
jgi:hypothetical protein